jgi:hypothetical protein
VSKALQPLVSRPVVGHVGIPHMAHCFLMPSGRQVSQRFSFLFSFIKNGFADVEAVYGKLPCVWICQGMGRMQGVNYSPPIGRK